MRWNFALLKGVFEIFHSTQHRSIGLWTFMSDAIWIKAHILFWEIDTEQKKKKGEQTYLDLSANSVLQWTFSCKKKNKENLVRGNFSRHQINFWSSFNRRLSSEIVFAEVYLSFSCSWGDEILSLWKNEIFHRQLSLNIGWTQFPPTNLCWKLTFLSETLSTCSPNEKKRTEKLQHF